MTEPLVELHPDPGGDVAAAVAALLERERLLGTPAAYDSPWRRAALAEGIDRGGAQAGVPRNSRGAARA